MSMGNNWVAQPPQAFPVAAPRKPGMAGVIVGIILMVLGPIIGVILIVASVGSFALTVSSAPTFQADSTQYQVSVDKVQQMGIWISSSDSGSCTIADPGGNILPLDTASFVSQTVNAYQLVGVFNPTTTGTYTVSCQGDSSSFDYRVAPVASVAGFAAGLGLGILLIVFAFIIGLIVLIVSIVRRGNWTRKYGQQAQPMYPPQYYQPQPGQYPQQPPQYPQQPPQYPPAPPQYPPAGQQPSQ